MNVTRTTLLGSSTRAVADVGAASAALAAVQGQLSSGKRITTASDDPDGTVVAMGLRGALARSDQYASASADATAWLSTLDSAYSQGVSVLQSARTLVLQAMNSGAADGTAAQAQAAQLDALRSTLLSIANTDYDGRPVFGGTTAGPVAYDGSGAYVGDTGSVTRVIAPRTTVTVGATGTDVFGAAGSTVFGLLASAADSLRLTGTVPDSVLQDLDTATNRLSTAQATAGAAAAQVQRAQAVRTQSTTALTTRLTDVEQVDLADAALRLAAANTAYQAALQTTAVVGRQSLLDFLS